MTKKEARSRASPPAAGRFCDKILFRRMAILAERFYVIGRTFLWHKKLISGEKIGNLYRATSKMLLNLMLIQNHVYKKSSSH